MAIIDVWRIDGGAKQGEFWVKSDTTDMICINVPTNPSSRWIGMHIMDVWKQCFDMGLKCTLLETHKNVHLPTLRRAR